MNVKLRKKCLNDMPMCFKTIKQIKHYNQKTQKSVCTWTVWRNAHIIKLWKVAKVWYRNLGQNITLHTSFVCRIPDSGSWWWHLGHMSFICLQLKLSCISYFWYFKGAFWPSFVLCLLMVLSWHVLIQIGSDLTPLLRAIYQWSLFPDLEWCMIPSISFNHSLALTSRWAAFRHIHPNSFIHSTTWVEIQ